MTMMYGETFCDCMYGTTPALVKINHAIKTSSYTEDDLPVTFYKPRNIFRNIETGESSSKYL